MFYLYTRLKKWINMQKLHTLCQYNHLSVWTGGKGKSLYRSNSLSRVKLGGGCCDLRPVSLSPVYCVAVHVERKSLSRSHITHDNRDGPLPLPRPHSSRAVYTHFSFCSVINSSNMEFPFLRSCVIWKKMLCNWCRKICHQCSADIFFADCECNHIIWLLLLD